MNNDIIVQQTTVINAKAGNKLAYKLTVEDSLKKTKAAVYYISLMKLDMSPAVVDFKGFEVDEKQLNTINTYEDAVNIASKKDIINLMIPWHKIISIENILYRQRTTANGDKK